MSFVAVAVIQNAAAIVGNFEALRPPVVPADRKFQQCEYCSRYPDDGQREACCRGCGAPLVPAEIPAPLAAAPAAQEKEGRGD